MRPRSQTPSYEGAWAWQAREAAVQAGQLGIHAYAIYCALTHFESAASTEHKRRFAVSYEQIAEHVGCSRGTVRVAIEQLEKAQLIRRFSGSNGSKRATRNCFFLAEISRSPDDRGRSPRDRDVRSPHDLGRSPHDLHVRSPRDRFNKKENKNNRENSFSAPPQAAAGETKRENQGHACPPLGGGSGPKKTRWEIIEEAGI